MSDQDKRLLFFLIQLMFSDSQAKKFVITEKKHNINLDLIWILEIFEYFSVPYL